MWAVGWFPGVAGSLVILGLDFPLCVCVCALVVFSTVFLQPVCLSPALFLGHQENEFSCHPTAFESHLMFARLQGSPSEVLPDVTCDVRAEVTHGGRKERELVDKANQKRANATDICQ